MQPIFARIRDNDWNGYLGKKSLGYERHTDGERLLDFAKRDSHPNNINHSGACITQFDFILLKHILRL